MTAGSSASATTTSPSSPTSIRLLVEELYRSNAGFVGPKLVSWDDPGVLQHVGLGLDRFGEVDPITEPGEYDQEQHDAVRDVFVLPSACLLARADLFRTLGGFDPAITFHGDDVDLCWRAHLSGARVVVAPQARVRHREELDVRRPDLHHDLLRARHRMRSVATLTGGARLPVRSLELALLTVVELVVGLFTGRFGEAWASLRGFVGLLPRTPALLARRGTVAKLRQVDDAEVLSLQTRGSARLTAYRRAHDTETYVGAHETVRRWRESSLGTTIVWVVVVVAILVASRTLIDTSVPAVGELLPLPASARVWWGDFTSAWSAGGLGNAVANPTGWACCRSAACCGCSAWASASRSSSSGPCSSASGGRGGWRRCSRRTARAWPCSSSTPRCRSCPASSRPGGSRRSSGTPRSRGSSTCCGRPSASAPPTRRPPTTSSTGSSASAGASDSAAPRCVALVAAPRLPWHRPCSSSSVIVAIVLAVAGLAAGSGLRTAGWTAGLGLVACAAAWLLNLPWSPTWSWDDTSSPALAGPLGRGVVDVASMAIGQARFEVAALALYVPVLVALAVARAWRLTWAARAAGLVVVFLALAVLQDRDALPVPGARRRPAAGARRPRPGSVRRRRRGGVRPGRRRPHVRLAPAGRRAVDRRPSSFGVLPAAADDHRRRLVHARAPASSRLVEAPLLTADEVGDYRVLYLGDPRLIPFPSDDLGGGVAMALVDDGGADLARSLARPRPGRRRRAARGDRARSATPARCAPAACSLRSASATSSCR